MDGLSEARLNELREYSLQDLSKTGLFTVFEENNIPFENNSGSLYCKLWYEDHVKILERVENGEGKKLGFDSSSQTWFFEHWHDEKFLKSWKQNDRSWGEIVNKQVAGVQTTESWNFITGEQSYEFYHLETDNEYGSKAGFKPGLSWKEIWHKKPEDSALEKYWDSPSAKWGEKSGQTGKKSWSLEWREENGTFEEKSKNEESGRTWGHIKGKSDKGEWGEQWSVEPTKKSNDRWWSENDRKWGIKTINEAESEFCEEWEIKPDYNKSIKSFKDSQGIRTRLTEGSGPGFNYTEDYKYDPIKDEHTTSSKGFSPDGKWENLVYKQGSKNYAKYKGEDANGSWEEEWEEDGGDKKAWKKGKSVVWGEWEENWTENGEKKTCKKWGQRGERWVEEWTEDSNGKSCRKEQVKDGKVFVQQWEEEFGEGVIRSFGKFYEDGVVVKEWDYVRKDSI